MSSVAARRFTALLEDSISDDGLTTRASLRKLVHAKQSIKDPTELAAAGSLLDLLEHDRELDRNEVGPSRVALRTLLGKHEGRLPVGIERALRRAVPAANVLVKHYDLTLDLTGDGPFYPARAIVQLEHKAKREVILEVDPQRLSIDSVRDRGRAVPFRVEGTRLFINAAGATKIDIGYRVRATDDENGYGLIHDAKKGSFSTLTWPYLTGSLFPSSSTTADGVTATLSVKTKRGTTVVGSGSDGRGKLSIDNPVPPYSIALYAGEFNNERPIVSKTGVTVTVHGHGNSVRRETRKEYQRAVAHAIDYFSAWLGPYRYGDHLRLVEVPGDYGGMEHAGAVALMIGAMRALDSAVETAVHETAHHWFGDNLRIENSGEFWMSEGFTNYITYRFLGERYGEPKLRAHLDAARDAVKAALRNRQRILEGPDHIDAKEIFTDIPYELGPWILRMMATELGDEKFDALLGKWFKAQNFDTVSTEEFMKFMRDETGRDFNPFFKAWSSIKSIPSFKDRSKIKGTEVEVRLDARGDHPKGMKIPLVVEGAKQRATFWIDPTKPEVIDPGFIVKRLLWDPERRVLAQIDR